MIKRYAPLRGGFLSLFRTALLVILALLLGSFFKDAIPSVERVRVRGLESVDLDRWIKTFPPFAGKPEMPFSERGAYEKELGSAFGSYFSNPDDDTAFREFYSALLGAAANARGSGPELLQFAAGLVRIRDHWRAADPIIRTRKVNFLAELLIEETLYLALKRGAPMSSAWFVFGPSAECVSGEPPTDFYGISGCAGDVVISKGDAFSSALNAFRMPLAASYSHSAILIPDPGTGSLRLLEVDGLAGGLNRFEEESAPARLTIYRIRDRANAPAIRSALDRASALVHSAMPKDSDRPSEDRPLFGFNLTLRPDCTPGRYYCSELNYCLFHDSGIEDSRNPYSKKFWSEPFAADENFIDRIWPVYPGAIPEPSDVELNAAYLMVGHRVNLEELSRMRIQFATLNALASLFRDDPVRREAYLGVLRSYGESTLAYAKPALMESIGRLVGLKPSQWIKLRALLPSEIRVGEIVFYYHIQHLLLPEVERRLGALDCARCDPIPLEELGGRALPLIRAAIDQFVRRGPVSTGGS